MPAPISHLDARRIIAQAFAARGISAPSAAELQGAQAIALYETVYSRWTGASVAPHNWGGIMCVTPPQESGCKPGCLPWGDTDGSGHAVAACFRIYSSDVEGAADMIRELYRRDGVPAALATGNAARVAERMSASGYMARNPADYARGIAARAATIAAALSEPVVVGLSPVASPPPAAAPPVLVSNPPAPAPKLSLASSSSPGGVGALIILGGLAMIVASSRNPRGAA